MSTLTTAALSFGADPMPPRPATSRQKTEARTKAEQARLDALPVQCRAWADALDLDALDAMGEVAKHYKAEGYAPVRLHVPTLAKAMKCDDRDAADRLERCIKAGAVERTRRIAADPVFRPVARGTIPVTKAERDLADLRNVVEDARAKIEGKPLPQRAAKQESTFPAGTLMGLQRRG